MPGRRENKIFYSRFLDFTIAGSYWKFPRLPFPVNSPESFHITMSKPGWIYFPITEKYFFTRKIKIAIDKIYNPWKLYIGNLSPDVSQELLLRELGERAIDVTERFYLFSHDLYSGGNQTFKLAGCVKIDLLECG